MKADGRLYGDPWWAALINTSPKPGVRRDNVGPSSNGRPLLTAPSVKPLYTWTRRYAW